jgi:CBS domain-containing protein
MKHRQDITEVSPKDIVRVRDVMIEDVDVVDGMATVADALLKMRHTETKMFIVQKRHEDDEFGVLLLSDIARKVLACDRNPQRVNVYEVMEKPAISVHPDMDIRYCARLFDKFDIARAPVIAEGRLMGVVTFTDLIQRGMLKQLHDAE